VTRLQPVTSADAAKRTLLLELSLGDSGMVFEPGDAFGILPENCPEYVTAAELISGILSVIPRIPDCLAVCITL
jgi:sulfite reductase alpha subunit-like flavoprotein